MSGPYPPPGYPRQPQPGGGWGDQPQQPQYDFPTVQYGGLTTPHGGWHEPPRPPRNTARLVVAVISVLVIIGGVVTAAVVLTERNTHQTATPPPTVTPTSTRQSPTQVATTTPADPGVPNGSTVLTLAKGACVTAQATADNQYSLGHQVTCGTGQSDLVLATVSPAMSGCPDHQYLRVAAPAAGVYCFTLDVKKGDCVDASFLKSPCAAGAFSVLSTEAGPGDTTSCAGVTGATHWVPIGHDPVAVACIGPARVS
jgi:hypothetical protein